MNRFFEMFNTPGAKILLTTLLVIAGLFGVAHGYSGSDVLTYKAIRILIRLLAAA
jgi:hypothetical protein